MPRFKLRTLLGLVALCAVGSCTIGAFQNRVTYNATRESVWMRLPEDATRINLFEPGAFGPNRYFEFDTSEESFLTWVREISTVERADYPAPYTIHRYTKYAPDADATYEVTIVNGHLFEWTEEDMGQYIAYDADAGRAYYWSHSR